MLYIRLIVANLHLVSSNVMLVILRNFRIIQVEKPNITSQHTISRTAVHNPHFLPYPSVIYT